jgi:catabolite regulation protein CreA
VSVLDICERERLSLEAVGDPQMQGVLLAISRLQAEIIAALATLGPP